MVFNRFTLTGLLILSLGLTSCTYNPFRPSADDNNLTGSATSTAIGAAAGFGTAVLLEAPKPVVALATIGGASIGYYVSTLRFASGGVIQSGGQVFTLGEYVTIEIPTDRIFDTNSADLLPEAAPILDSAVAVLNRYPNDNIMISGNTSGFGTTRWERKLSEDRARQVAAYLWANGINNFRDTSIQMRKLIYTGYGNYFPIANNIHNDSIRQNSRIQITGYPSSADLHLDNCHKVFTNIGDMDEPLPSRGRTREFAPNDGRLREAPYTNRSDYKGVLNERPSTETLMAPQNHNYYFDPASNGMRQDRVGYKD